MKTLRLFLVLVISWFVAAPVFGAEDEGPGKAAEKFYAGYVAAVDANKDTKAWVTQSKLVTAKFRKAYLKIMNSEEIDADPVLNAQDIPSKPFLTEKEEITGDAAKVVVASSFGEDKHRLKLKLLKVDGVWLLDELPN